MKHKFITGFFFTVIVLQFGFGIFMTYETIVRPGTCRSFRVHLGPGLMKPWFFFPSTAHPVHKVDFPEGHLCMYKEHRVEEIIYTVLSLFFGKHRGPLCTHS